jgi:hypothetical protein
VGYVNLDTIHRASNLAIPPHQWGDQVNDNFTLLSGAAGAEVDTIENTTSTTYGNLTTVGPFVTLNTGGNAIVILTAQIFNSGTNANLMGFAVSGATVINPVDADAARSDSTFAVVSSMIVFVAGLAAGSNTFSAKYRTTGGTASFGNRKITVIPLP